LNAGVPPADPNAKMQDIDGSEMPGEIEYEAEATASAEAPE
jgi:hypothetical protein